MAASRLLSIEQQLTFFGEVANDKVHETADMHVCVKHIDAPVRNFSAII